MAVIESLQSAFTIREEGITMSISAALLPEFDHEMATTRRTLERVPDDKLGWKPHEKSMSLGRLASHIAEMPSWGVVGLNLDAGYGQL